MANERILVIENERDISTVWEVALSSSGYEVKVANDGVEGMDIYDNFDPDLVITDMMMPRMGGFPVLEKLKTVDDPPPVIMITANEGGRHKAYAEMETPNKIAVSQYLRKPVQPDALIEVVERLLAGRTPKPKKKTTASGSGERRIMKRRTKKTSDD